MVTADQIRSWCANPDTQVTVKPVIDLNEHIHVEGYEVPERLREQTRLRDHTCVFPWCTRSPRKADADHVIPYAKGGATSSDNIAPLCRRHHRLKTHSTWRYTMLEPGTFLWSRPRLPVPARPHRDPRRQPRPTPIRRSTGPVAADRSMVPAGFRRTALWSRLSTRFARCSTTCGCGPLVWSGRSLRSLPRPPVAEPSSRDARDVRLNVRRCRGSRLPGRRCRR